jgi:lipopolysaccharide transport system ATP-binding protein
MSEYAVALTAVSKSFCRFQSPGWRALHALGLPVSSTRYDVFDALKGIDLTINKGERVALIGRNGAGKSTLLRLIAGQMKADAGRIQVNGQVQALMSLGTGFHPDFNALQNIRSALAYQGISAGRVDECIEDIVEFTELDNFLHRPVKEYSSGMYARLAFAVATSITPQVLIIDEVLGAGDAYFMGKCIQRMKALTSQGATIIFVSHDIGSVQMLCDRGIWLDHGSIRQDGDLLPVSKAYLASVREEEEKRVRAKSMSLTRTQVASIMASEEEVQLMRVVASHGGAPSAPFTLGDVSYGDLLGTLGTITPEADATGTAKLIVDPLFMNWKPLPGGWEFGNFGGRYGHGPFQLAWPRKARGSRWIELRHRPSIDTPVSLEYFDTGLNEYVRIHEVPAAASPHWTVTRIALPDAESDSEIEQLLAELAPLSPVDRYGSGEVAICGFGFFDAAGDSRHTLISGESASAVLAYQASRQVIDPVPVVAIYRPDGTCALQVIASLEGQHFASLQGRGGIRVRFDPLLLGPGDYLVSVALFRELDLSSSIEPAAYDLHDRCYALKVLPPPGINVQIGIVNQPATWEALS